MVTGTGSQETITAEHFRLHLQDGQAHNTSGPAVETLGGRKYYALDGRFYQFEDFIAANPEIFCLNITDRGFSYKKYCFDGAVMFKSAGSTVLCDRALNEVVNNAQVFLMSALFRREIHGPFRFKTSNRDLQYLYDLVSCDGRKFDWACLGSQDEQTFTFIGPENRVQIRHVFESNHLECEITPVHGERHKLRIDLSRESFVQNINLFRKSTVAAEVVKRTDPVWNSRQHSERAQKYFAREEDIKSVIGRLSSDERSSYETVIESIRSGLKKTIGVPEKSDLPLDIEAANRYNKELQGEAVAPLADQTDAAKAGNAVGLNELLPMGFGNENGTENEKISLASSKTESNNVAVIKPVTPKKVKVVKVENKTDASPTRKPTAEEMEYHNKLYKELTWDEVQSLRKIFEENKPHLMKYKDKIKAASRKALANKGLPEDFLDRKPAPPTVSVEEIKERVLAEVKQSLRAEGVEIAEATPPAMEAEKAPTIRDGKIIRAELQTDGTRKEQLFNGFKLGFKKGVVNNTSKLAAEKLVEMTPFADNKMVERFAQICLTLGTAELIERMPDGMANKLGITEESRKNNAHLLRYTAGDGIGRDLVDLVADLLPLFTDAIKMLSESEIADLTADLEQQVAGAEESEEIFQPVAVEEEVKVAVKQTVEVKR